MRTIEDYERSSLLYWYPKIKDLDIPTPKTIIYEIPKQELIDIRRENGVPISMAEKVKPLIKELGYPLFLKTDQAAGKHSWDQSCFVQSEEVLQRHIFEVIDANLNADMMGLPFKALVFRKYIPLVSTFKAFGGNMPVAKERRYFISDGLIQCKHPYWPEGAIEEWASISEHNENKLPKNWKQLLKELNRETAEERQILELYALRVASVLDGYWSVDFAKGNDGEWYLIDMADGEMSFHELTCKYCPEEIRKAYEKEVPMERPEVVVYTEDEKEICEDCRSQSLIKGIENSINARRLPENAKELVGLKYLYEHFPAMQYHSNIEQIKALVLCMDQTHTNYEKLTTDKKKMAKKLIDNEDVVDITLTTLFQWFGTICGCSDMEQIIKDVKETPNK